MTRTRTEPIIEAEVVEIDGVAIEARPQVRKGVEETRYGWRDWQTWHGWARELGAGWWPLWVLLGISALVLAVAAGMCGIILFVTYKVCRITLRGIFALIAPSHRLQRY